MSFLPDFASRPPWWRYARSLLGLAALVFGVVSSPPADGWAGPALIILVTCLPVCVASWLIWLFAEPTRWLVTVAMIAGTAAGLALAVGVPAVALAFPAVACAVAGAYRSPRFSVPLTVVAGSAFVIARTVIDGFRPWVLIGPAAVTAGLLVGFVRRQSIRLADETKRAQEEQARAAALGERARLAREIHDVLAHTLSALSVQLETVDALLERDRAEQARQGVARAARLSREGLAETRRAIGALRGETLPLAEMLERLAAEYRTDLQAPATVHIGGAARELDPDATLALYRTAQEAMTNVRKHAPGAPVAVDLTYRDAAVSLRVTNGSTPDGATPSLSGSGGGYGLTGLRERAELSGGEFAAEPTGDGYQVEIRIAA